MSASAWSRPRSRSQTSATQSGYESLERAFRQRVDELSQPLRETAHDGIRERHRALEVRAADELDALVHGCMGGDGVEVGELVRADPKGGQHRRIELAHGTAAEGFDSVIERANALHRAVSDALGQRAVAIVE